MPYQQNLQWIDSIQFNGIRLLNLRYIVIDSAFHKKVEKGTILEQDPIARTKVKKNRRVYFTINALQNKIVNFPNIIDLSLTKNLLGNTFFLKLSNLLNERYEKPATYSQDGRQIRLGFKSVFQIMMDEIGSPCTKIVVAQQMRLVNEQKKKSIQN